MIYIHSPQIAGHAKSSIKLSADTGARFKYPPDDIILRGIFGSAVISLLTAGKRPELQKGYFHGMGDLVIRMYPHRLFIDFGGGSIFFDEIGITIDAPKIEAAIPDLLVSHIVFNFRQSFYNGFIGVDADISTKT